MLDFAINKRKKPRTLFYISHCHKKHRNCKKLSYGMLVNRHLVLCFQREFLFFREISLKLYNFSIKNKQKILYQIHFILGHILKMVKLAATILISFNLKMYFWKHWGTPFWEGYDDFLPSALPNQGPFFPWTHQK